MTGQIVAFTILTGITAFALVGWWVMESAYLSEREAHRLTRALLRETSGALTLAFAAMEEAREAMANPITVVRGSETPIGDGVVVDLFRGQLDEGRQA